MKMSWERLLSGAALKDVLLGALVENGSIRHEDGVDRLAQLAGEEAVLTLGEFGLMDRVPVLTARHLKEKGFSPKTCKSGGIGRIKSKPTPT